LSENAANPERAVLELDIPDGRLFSPEATT
jgi:hypothetical protein